MPFEWNDRMRLRERDEDLLCGTMCSDVSLKTHAAVVWPMSRGERRIGRWIGRSTSVWLPDIFPPARWAVAEKSLTTFLRSSKATHRGPHAPLAQSALISLSDSTAARWGIELCLDEIVIVILDMTPWTKEKEWGLISCSVCGVFAQQKQIKNEVRSMRQKTLAPLQADGFVYFKTAC